MRDEPTLRRELSRLKRMYHATIARPQTEFHCKRGGMKSGLSKERASKAQYSCIRDHNRPLFTPSDRRTSKSGLVRVLLLNPKHHWFVPANLLQRHARRFGKGILHLRKLAVWPARGSRGFFLLIGPCSREATVVFTGPAECEA